MTDESGTSISRRKFVAASGTGIAAMGLAGCTQNGDGKKSGGKKTQLTADGSSTVYPITSKAASFWNYNPPSDDGEYWPHDKYGISTDKRLADYWAGQYGIKAGKGGSAPFRVSIGLSHSSVGGNKVMKGKVDIGDMSAPVQAELPDRDSYTNFKNHVVGIDGMQIIVSKAIKDAGVTQMTKQEVADIYKGNITNWSDVDGYNGPSKEIQCVGRVEGSGTRTIFHQNILGDPKAKAPGADSHKGENQQVKATVQNSDNALGYVGIAFVDPNKAPAVDLKVGDTVYSPENENLGSKDYPLNRDLHCYTWKETDKYESAFLAMILSDMGQEEFVAANNYIKLTEERRKNQMSKLKQK
ncbi:MAG: PstS family phosphate ABC transporter substrate-binding protein [Halorientalis sp.]